MEIGFTTAKGGQGATVTAAAFAVLCSEHTDTALITGADGFRALGAPVRGSLTVSDTLTVHHSYIDRNPYRLNIYDGQEADRTYLVTRGCYLALAAAVENPSPITGVILIEEPGRALGALDVSRALGADVVARIPYDPTISRAVDAGLFVSRIPAVMREALRPLIPAEVTA